MATYVFVHGAWHGAWCWEKVVPLLAEKGHRVLAIDLPGHGNDKTPIGEVGVNAYTKKVCTILSECEEPVILVGHSMGGIVISQSAEKLPEKVSSLVYVSAFLLKNNQSINDLNHLDPEVAAASFVTDDGVSFSVKDDSVKELFYGCTNDEDIIRAKSLLQPENFLTVSATKLSLTDRFANIPRYYIENLQDRAIPHGFQKMMYEELPCKKVLTINTDHSPFYSAPHELASHLLSIGQ